MLANSKIRPKKILDCDYGTSYQEIEELGSKILPLNLHSTMSRAEFLLSNYTPTNRKIEIDIHDSFNKRELPSIISNEDTCIAILKNESFFGSQNGGGTALNLAEQIKSFCRGRFIDTQCFPAVKIPKEEEYRIRWHINYAYNSVFVNWYILQDILEKFAPGYPKMELENSDVILTIKNHLAKMSPHSEKYVDEFLKENYDEKFFIESLSIFKRAYRNLDTLKSWMMVKQRCCHNIIDDKKPKIKIHVYGKTGRERIYEKVKTWDGAYSLEIPSELKTKLYKWYATEKRKCVKELKSKLSPYFVTR